MTRKTTVDNYEVDNTKDIITVIVTKGEKEIEYIISKPDFEEWVESEYDDPNDWDEEENRFYFSAGTYWNETPWKDISVDLLNYIELKNAGTDVFGDIRSAIQKVVKNP